MLPGVQRLFIRRQHVNGGAHYEEKLQRLVETARNHIDGLTGVREVELLKSKVPCRPSHHKCSKVQPHPRPPACDLGSPPAARHAPAPPRAGEPGERRPQAGAARAEGGEEHQGSRRAAAGGPADAAAAAPAAQAVVARGRPLRRDARLPLPGRPAAAPEGPRLPSNWPPDAHPSNQPALTSGRRATTAATASSSTTRSASSPRSASRASSSSSRRRAPAPHECPPSHAIGSPPHYTHAP